MIPHLKGALGPGLSQLHNSSRFRPAGWPEVVSLLTMDLVECRSRPTYERKGARKPVGTETFFYFGGTECCGYLPFQIAEHLGYA
jgi:hypothetical protein